MTKNAPKWPRTGFDSLAAGIYVLTPLPPREVARRAGKGIVRVLWRT